MELVHTPVSVLAEPTNCNKIIDDDGTVAILIHYSFGLGWYSVHKNVELLFEPAIVEYLITVEAGLVDETYLNEMFSKLKSYLTLKYSSVICEYSNYVFFDIIKHNLSLAWIKKGEPFLIEKDGGETLVRPSTTTYLLA